jgi:hypothetical protein
MRFRKLQQLINDDRWEDHGYAYEFPDGRCAFRHNTLVWESTGSRLSAKLYKSGTKLEDVQIIIPTGDRLRWLDIEEVEGDMDEIKIALDEICAIPSHRNIKKKAKVVAA